MNTKEQFVITINRELGSGGRTVGRKLAEKLGVPFYDKAVVKALSKKYHLTTEEIERLKGLKHNWWTELKRTWITNMNLANSVEYYMPVEGDEPDLLKPDDVFKAESEIIKGIAEDESCVIAGRSGFYVLRDHPNHLSILIQSPMESRIARVMQKQKLSREDAVKAIEKVDQMRENYVSHYTKTSRYDTRNYDLVINSAGKTEDQVVDLIVKFIEG